MIVLEHPPGYLPERAYIARVMMGEFLGLPYRLQESDRLDWAIYVEDYSDKVIHFADILFQTPASQWLQPESLQMLSESSMKDEFYLHFPSENPGAVALLYGHPLEDGQWLLQSPGAMRFGLDLFGSAFFMLARYEELACPKRDEHERFPAAASFTFRAGLMERPIVNEYLELLWAALQWLAPALQRSERRYRCLPTHDVDWLRASDFGRMGRVLRAAGGDVIKRHDPGLAIRRVRASFLQSRGILPPGADPYDTFDFLMSESERRNLCSAFYFITDQTAGAVDGVYDINDVMVRQLMRDIHGRGHEIGLHPSYHTFRDPAQTKREFDRLRETCEVIGVHQEQWGGRQHFLRWENPTTWLNWDSAGLHYDSTLGYADGVGFRCGTCYEYPVYDLLGRRTLNLHERPLIVMEVALFESMRLNETRAMEKLERLVRACRHFKGDFVFLWHNSQLASARQKRFYREVLAIAG